MPDLIAGREVLALDFPPSLYDYNDDQVLNITATEWSATGGVGGTTVVSVDFLAPTTERACVSISAGMRTPGVNRVVCSFIVQDTVTSQVVQGASLQRSGICCAPNNSVYEYHSRDTLVDGLLPGRLYLVEFRMKVYNAIGQDIRGRRLNVAPAP